MQKLMVLSLFKRNILKFIDCKGIRKSQFYRETGITRGVLDHTSGLSEDNVSKFLATYKEVSLDWFFRGEGEMISPLDRSSHSEKSDLGVETSSIESQLLDILSQFIDNKLEPYKRTVDKLEAIVGYNIMEDILKIDEINPENNSEDIQKESVKEN